MRKKKVGALTIKGFALLVLLATAYQAVAQDATTPYPKMAQIDQYLMADQGAQIALARSAAPESISRDGKCRFPTCRNSGPGQERFSVYRGARMAICSGC